MKKLIGPIAIALVIVGIWAVYYNWSASSYTVMAIMSGHENAFNANGVVVRNEQTIPMPEEGTLQSSVGSGQRVTVGTLVARVYSGDIPDDTMNKIKNLNDRINDVEQGQTERDFSSYDINGINKKIGESAAEISYYAAQGQHLQINKIKREINQLLQRKAILQGGADADGTSILNGLIDEKTTLENSVSALKTDIFAPASGLFFDSSDGYEAELPMSGIEELSPDTIVSILKKTEVTRSQNTCKIVDNNSWALALCVNKNNIQGAFAGDEIYLRVNSYNENLLPATIRHIAPYTDNEDIVFIECSRFAGNVYVDRIINVDVVLKQYLGLKVPAAAVKQIEDKYTVTTLKMGLRTDKEIELVYIDNDVAIIKENSVSEDALAAYDTVLVGG